jgi:hypothetical protein
LAQFGQPVVKTLLEICGQLALLSLRGLELVLLSLDLRL